MSTGNLLSGNVPNARPQFKKQASSFGTGHVHNMAVIVAPTKIDYSVTKGGLKTWAVVVTFILLCFTMAAIISEVEDDDYDGNGRDVNPFMTAINEDEEKDESKNKPTIIPEDVVVKNLPMSMEDEEDNKDLNLEIKLFEDLQKKIEKNKKHKPIKTKDVVILDDEDDDEEENISKNYGKPLIKEFTTDQHLKKGTVKEEETNLKKDKGKKKQSENESPKKKQQIDDDEDGDDEKENIKIAKKTKSINKSIKEKKELPEDSEEDDKNSDNDEEEEDDDDDEDDEDEATEFINKYRSKNPTRNKAVLLRKKRLYEIYSEKRPRKSLLKKKKHLNKQQYIKNDDDDNNSEEEDDDNDSKEEEEEKPSRKERTEESELYEVSTTKKPKYLGSYKKLYTNKKDQKFRAKLDAGDLYIEKHDFESGEAMYNEVLKQYPESPRAHYGRGRLYEIRAEFENSNNLMDQAMLEYQIILDDNEATDGMFREASEGLIRCARFRGNLHKVLTVQRIMIDKDPENLDLQNEFGITFLMMGRHEEAKKIFLNILNENSNNSRALAYYGYILKVFDKDIVNGVFHMKKSIQNGDLEHNDSKFFYHLGDGLMRLGRRQEAYKVYEKGAELGLFLSTYQRSIYNRVGLTARPWWSIEQSGCVKSLKSIEKQWVLLREEIVELWKENGDKFLPEEPHLTDGSQKYFSLFDNGKVIEKNCLLAPRTCAILEKYIKGEKCFKESSKISILQSHTTVWPHCSTTNQKLIAHLCLVTSSEARIRVGEETRGWKNGKFIIYDESFEHELTYEGAAAGNNRIVLSIDLWHPEVPLEQRNSNIDISY
uniref:TPR_REGION domain-containing protein n=1 Tax=Parastrongyloides trichosuri TaxID=131310 RepID=A0A0N4ZM61_PARTI